MASASCANAPSRHSTAKAGPVVEQASRQGKRSQEMHAALSQRPPISIALIVPPLARGHLNQAGGRIRRSIRMRCVTAVLRRGVAPREHEPFPILFSLGRLMSDAGRPPVAGGSLAGPVSSTALSRSFPDFSLVRFRSFGGNVGLRLHLMIWREQGVFPELRMSICKVALLRYWRPAEGGRSTAKARLGVEQSSRQVKRSLSGAGRPPRAVAQGDVVGADVGSRAMADSFGAIHATTAAGGCARHVRCARYGVTNPLGSRCSGMHPPAEIKRRALAASDAK
jgi:hypothetical protein